MKRIVEQETPVEIHCTERWDLDCLEQIKQLKLNRELRRQLEKTRPMERVQVCYSTKGGDALGRVYGNVVNARDEDDDEDLTGGVSLQGMCGWVRRLIAQRFYRDYDIANCAPVLLAQTLAQHQLECVALIEYNERRDQLFEKYAPGIVRRELKQAFLTVIHMGGVDERIAELASLKRELRRVLVRLAALPIYSALYADCERACTRQRYDRLVGEARTTKVLGKFCALVWNREEHRVLMAMRQYFVQCGRDAQRMVLCFDGLMLERQECETELSMQALSQHVYDTVGYRVQIEEKSLEPSEEDWRIYRGEVPPPVKRKK